MKLTFEQIKECTLGSVLTEQRGEEIYFHRFTAEQEGFYALRESTVSRATSGVKLSFLTDSESLFLKVITEKVHSRTYFSVDLFVDGEFFGAISNFDEEQMGRKYVLETFPMGEFEETFLLPSGEKEILIHFPSLAETRLLEVSLSDGASFSPKKPEKKLICYGDSITEGFDALHSFRKYTARLASFLGMEEFNKGVGGEIFRTDLSALRDDFTPDLITVAYGTNDWSKLERSVFEENCSGFFRNLVKNYPETPILAITPIWRKIWQKEKPFGDFRYVNEFISRETEQYKNVIVIDGFGFIPPYSDYFADLTLHPNGAGYDRYFEGICAFLKEKGLKF